MEIGINLSMYPASCEIRIPNYCGVDEENELSNSVMEGADWGTVPYFQTNQVFGRDEMGFFRNIVISLRYHSGCLDLAIKGNFPKWLVGSTPGAV